MSTGWQVGDLAECITNENGWVYWDNSMTVQGPVRGEINRVTRVGSSHGYTTISFGDKYPPGWDWAALCFRKVQPPKHEQCEPEFVQLMNRCKPQVREPVNV